MTGCNHKYTQALYRTVLYFIALHFTALYTGLYAVLCIVRYAVLSTVLFILRSPSCSESNKDGTYIQWVGGWMDPISDTGWLDV
jgi:hypothetical protein